MNSKKNTSLNQPNQSAALSALAEAERRREDRVPASGTARLRVEGNPGWSIEGALLDTSQGGYCLLHSHGGLTTGTVVRFEFEDREGTARVCWNRIDCGRVQSGFYILSRRRA